QRKPRVFRGIGEVAEQHELAAAGIGGAIDGPNHWQRAIKHTEHHALEERVLLVPFFVAHAPPLLEVDARAESAVAPPRHDKAAPGFRVGVDVGKEIQDLAAHLSADGIADFWPIETHYKDSRQRGFDAQSLVAAKNLSHRASLLKFRF